MRDNNMTLHKGGDSEMHHTAQSHAITVNRTKQHMIIGTGTLASLSLLMFV